MSPRRAIQLPGVSHGPGRPAGSRIGNVICSATLPARDRSTGELAKDPEVQLRTLFDNALAFLEEAGAGLEDVIRVEVTLAGPAHREALNAEWLRRFPEGPSLPVRKVVMGEPGGGAVANLELMAVVSPEA